MDFWRTNLRSYSRPVKAKVVRCRPKTTRKKRPVKPAVAPKPSLTGEDYFARGVRDYEGRNAAKEPDLTKAFENFKKSAEMKHAKGMSSYAFMLATGEGNVESDNAPNEPEAVDWWRRSAEKGYTEAMFNLALCLQNGRGIDQDIGAAREWYEKGAALQDAVCQYHLGLLADKGIGMDVPDHKLAHEWYTKSAEQKFAKAMFNLGVLYYKGQGVEKDIEEAHKWWRRAADMGDTDAMYNIGLDERDRKKNYQAACRWFDKAAKLQHIESMFVLGVLMSSGEIPTHFFEQSKGEEHADVAFDDDTKNDNVIDNVSESQNTVSVTPIRKDYTTGVYWLQKAADLKHIHACFQLGIVYEEGRGQAVARNEQDARKFYSLAAEHGNHALAAYRVGLMCCEARGGKEDEDGAIYFFRTAAHGGIIDAQSRLGEMLLNRYIQTLSVTATCGAGTDNNDDVDNDTKEQLSQRQPSSESDDDVKLRDEAVEWLVNAAANNHPQATYLAGAILVCMLDGIPDTHYNGFDSMQMQQQKGLELLQQAVTHELSEAYFVLGQCYDQGIKDVIDADFEQSHTYWLSAAENDHVVAQCNIGYQFENGEGTDKDEELAVQWYDKAVKLESGQAMLNLALMLLDGRGCNPDAARARQLLVRSAELGYEVAQEEVEALDLDAMQQET
jgi:uncharacterized protein